jgi:hypothetical protein
MAILVADCDNYIINVTLFLTGILPFVIRSNHHYNLERDEQFLS